MKLTIYTLISYILQTGTDTRQKMVIITGSGKEKGLKVLLISLSSIVGIGILQAIMKSISSFKKL